MHNYKELKIWQRSVELATLVYSATANFPKQEQYGLTQQMRRAAVSIGTNIAEGAGRKGDKEFSYFLNVAYGSIYELETQLIISVNLGFLSKQDSEKLEVEIGEIQKMIFTLIKNLEARLNTQY